VVSDNNALSNGRHGFVSSAESSFALVLYERLSLSAVCARPWPTLSRAPAISNVITHTHTHTHKRTQLTHGAGTLHAGCRVHARQEVQRDQRNDGDQERHWCCCVQGPHVSRRSTSHHSAVSDLACCADAYISHLSLCVFRHCANACDGKPPQPSSKQNVSDTAPVGGCFTCRKHGHSRVKALLSWLALLLCCWCCRAMLPWKDAASEIDAC
jgi:hypothetical protein